MSILSTAELQRAKELLLSAERLRELLIYSPDSGEFRWKVDRGGTAVAGSLAGRINSKGYRMISLSGRKYKASRLAWLYMRGEWPSTNVDHRNRIRHDDRWANLREGTPSQHAVNKGANNASGVRGVSWHKRERKWRAQIMVAGKRRRLGYFTDKNEAAAAYNKAALAAFGEWASLNIDPAFRYDDLIWSEYFLSAPPRAIPLISEQSTCSMETNYRKEWHRTTLQ